MKVFLFKLCLACERHYTNILGTFFFGHFKLGLVYLVNKCSFENQFPNIFIKSIAMSCHMVNIAVLSQNSML